MVDRPGLCPRIRLSGGLLSRSSWDQLPSTPCQALSTSVGELHLKGFLCIFIRPSLLVRGADSTGLWPASLCHGGGSRAWHSPWKCGEGNSGTRTWWPWEGRSIQVALEAGQRAVGRDVGAGPGHPEAWRWSGDLKGGPRVEPWLCHSCCHDLDNHCSEPQFPFLSNGGQLG